jgi:hypothetical protein
MCARSRSILLLHCSPHSTHLDLVPSNFWKNIRTGSPGLPPLIVAIFVNSFNSSKILRNYLNSVCITLRDNEIIIQPSFSPSLYPFGCMEATYEINHVQLFHMGMLQDGIIEAILCYFPLYNPT